MVKSALEKLNIEMQYLLDTFDTAILIKKQKEELRLLRSAIACRDIQLGIIERLIDDPNYEMAGAEYDYETNLINKIQKLNEHFK
jgi:hypothetical protein